MKKNYAIAISFFWSMAASAQSLPFIKTDTYHSGIFNEGGTEIHAYDPASQRIFSTNGAENKLDIIDAGNLYNLSLITQVDLSGYDIGLNSVTVKNGIVAAVGEKASDPQANGKVLFFDTAGTFLKELALGAMPDMAMIENTASGLKLFTANEGEPNSSYTNDPEGSVSIVDLSNSPSSLTQGDVTTIDFFVLNNTAIDPLINIYGNNGQQSIAQDLEPEYIAVAENGTKAYVSLQENNALMIIDIASASIDTVVGLGYIDRSIAGYGLDASNDANTIRIDTYPNLYGMYQPDALKAFEVNGMIYVASANEGDARDYDAYGEEERIKNLTLDPSAFPNAAALQEDTVLGRLNVTTSLGDTDNDGDYDKLYNYGGRSFSIWNASGQLVWDSGDDFEQYLAVAYPNEFNSNNDDNSSFKSRSDDKGPEPEAITTGMVNGNLYAFIGLERMGGIMVYNINDPASPQFVMYELNRNFNVSETDSAAGDLGPEDLKFIPADENPSGLALLTCSNEISGTVTVYTVGYGLDTEEGSSLPLLSAYPNPTPGPVHLDEKGSFKIYDTNGRLITSTHDKNYVDLSGQPNGLYIIKDTRGNIARIIKK